MITWERMINAVEKVQRRLQRAAASLDAAGLPYAGVDMFLDGPGAKVRDAIHVLFASERVQPGYPYAAPDISEGLESAAGFRVLTLPALVRMKLTSFRDQDRVHLRDRTKWACLTTS